MPQFQIPPKQGILQEHPTLFDLLNRVADPILVVWVTVLFGYGFRWFGPDDFVRVLTIYGPLLCAAFFPLFDIYRSWRGTRGFTELRNITLAWLTVTVFFNFFIMVLADGSFQEQLLPYGLMTYPHYWWWSLSCWVTLLAFRLGLRQAMRWMRRHGYNQRRLVIVGAGKLGQGVLRNLQHAPWTGLKPMAFFDDDPLIKGDYVMGLPVAGTCSELAAFIRENRVDQVWIALPLRAEKRLRQLLYDLRHHSVDIRFVPDIFGFRLLNYSITEVAGVPLLELSASPMRGINRVLKSLEDYVVALVILALISPILLVIALAVRVTSPGPVLFKQLRHGWDGKPVEIWKFRTMVVHQEHRGRVTQASRHDPRITPLGRFLRRTSLDELPQFINVLQGRMSIVGPRPHALEHNEKYKDLVEGYMLRHRVKPGITGWAQINGWRGETDTLDKMRKRVEYDIYYIEHWSLALDIKIILLTIFRGFIHRNAY